LFAIYVPSDPEGRTDLEKYKKDWAAYINAGNKVQSVELREIAVRASPGEDAVVFSYVLFGKTKLADGKVTEE
jgi:hypothetical protein